MQQGVTVALATVLLASMMGAASLPSYPYFDQYFPLSPNLPEESQGPQSHPNWKDQEATKDHLDTRRIDLSIGASGLPPILGTMLFTGSADGPLKVDLKANDREDVFTSDSVPSPESGRFEKIALENPKFLKILEAEEIADRTTSPEEDAFVADDNFQDQGPGSVEVYKLDLFKDRSMLTPVLPRKTLSRTKSKTPKKANASQVNWKPKIDNNEVKTIQPKANGETNFFDKFPSDSLKDEVFGVGGVPELQVGCEGLEAWHRLKRSNETSNDNEKFDPTLYVTPLSVDLDLSEDEEDEAYEEMDELLKIQKMLTTTVKPSSQKNRGDIEATLKTPADLEAKLRRPDKLPVRGDLGESTSNDTVLPVGFPSSIADNGRLQGESRLDKEYVYSAPIGRQNNLSPAEKDASPLAAASGFQSFLTRGRKLLAIVTDDSDLEREKREILWGFGEDEGMIASEELETEEKRRERENERRRHEMMEHARRQEEDKRYRQSTGVNSLAMQRNVHLEVERIRQEYEDSLKKQLERNQGRHRDYSGLTERREENEENEEKRWKEKKWRMEERRKQEEERRKLEERVTGRGRYPSNSTRSESSRNFDDRMRAEEERRMREQDRKLRDYIQRNRPVAVVRPDGQGLAEEERRRMLERGRNRSSNSTRLTSNNDREARNAERRRQEEGRREGRTEERKLQDYIKRNQPVNISKRTNERTLQQRIGNNALEERRVMEDARRYDRRSRPNIRREEGRNHGPSAPVNVSPRRILQDEPWRRQEPSRLEVDRRLEQLRRDEEEEKRRREFARREDERRRAESRRYEEDRKRQEAVRVEAEKRRRELIEEEERRAWYGRREPSRMEEMRRRQETRLAPANLVHDVNRGRQEEDRRRLEAWRRAQSYQRRKQDYERRLMEQKRKEESIVSSRERQAWSRQEHERLNSLPVSAKIILRSKGTNVTELRTPFVNFSSRFKDEFDPPGINPHRQGLKAAHFPMRTTDRPPVKGPGACVWAILQCCSAKDRLNSCFESAGCPGISWDPNPCRSAIVEAARTKAMQFYAAADNN